jgi:hypothetical protein
MDQRDRDVLIFCGFHALAVLWFALTFAVLRTPPLWYFGVSIGAFGVLGNLLIDPLASVGYRLYPWWMTWPSNSLPYGAWRFFAHRVPAMLFVLLGPAIVVADLFFVSASPSR